MTKLNRIAAAFAFAALAVSASAAPLTYTVDGTHTFPRFSYSHFGYSTQLSRFDKTTGTVVFEGDKPKTIEGNLTIKGVTKPVTLTVTSFQAMPHPMLKKPAMGANAFTTIKRTEFNAGKYAPYVGDEVRIDIALEAIAM